MFFDAAIYATFVKECRAYGINVPIVPGIMCINAFGGFKRMTGFCKVRGHVRGQDTAGSRRRTRAHSRERATGRRRLTGRARGTEAGGGGVLCRAHSA